MPETSSSLRARRRRTRRRRIGAIGAGVVVLAAGGGAALAATGSSDPELITGTVTTGSVTQTVEASGTVSAPSTTSASFTTNGTVAEVEVAVGDTVIKGEVLAKLDATDLQNKLASAKATVASAEQRLQDDEDGQTSSSSTITGGSAAAAGSGTAQSASSTVTTDSYEQTKLTSASTAPSSPSSSAPSTGAQASGSQNDLKAAQQTVLKAQQLVDTDQTAVDTAQAKLKVDVATNVTLRDAQKTACEASATSAACTSARADYENIADALTADSTALDAAVSAQDKAIASLDSAISALDKVLAQSTSAASTSGGTASKSGTSKSGTSTSGASAGNGKAGSSSGSGGATTNGTGGATRASGSSTTGTTGSTSEPASASQLAADQAQIDSSKAQLRLARQNLAAGTLRSPIAGKVAAVGLTAGSSSGGSITILGVGNQVVAISVPLSQIDQVKTGQHASIQVDGRSSALQGTVTKIGLMSSTSGSLTTFPVTITLASGSPAVHDGVGADVTITTGTADGAVLVPNSAITTIATRHIVSVVSGGKARTVAVTLGVVGSDVSQVTGGLKAGARVKLADPGQALPSSTTSSTTSRFGAGGTTFPVGGFGRRGTSGR